MVTTVAVAGAASASGSSVVPACAVTCSASLDWMCSIEVTLPTFTPAIRTGEAGRIFADEGNTAFTV